MLLTHSRLLACALLRWEAVIVLLWMGLGPANSTLSATNMSRQGQTGCRRTYQGVGTSVQIIRPEASFTNCISGLVVEYIVALDVTRVRFPADALSLSLYCIGGQKKRRRRA